MSKIRLRIHGSCEITLSDGTEISGVKKRAMIVLLATAPHGRRSRDFLEQMLWGDPTNNDPRASLRQALSSLRRDLGADFNLYFASSNEEIAIVQDRLEFVTKADDGPFLEGFVVKSTGFTEWLEEHRNRQNQLIIAPPTRALVHPDALMPVVLPLPLQIFCDGDGDDGGGAELESLADSFVRDLNQSLARERHLSVISHLSARSYSLELFSLSEIRKKLDADYALTGAIKTHGAQRIVNFELISLKRGEILWAEVFPLNRDSQSEGLRQLAPLVARRMGQEIVDASVNAANSAHPTSVDAMNLVIGGISLMHRSSFLSFAKGRALIEEAMKRVGETCLLNALLAKWYLLSVTNGWSSNPYEDRTVALSLIDDALDLDSKDSLALAVKGFVMNRLFHDHDSAMTFYDAALEQNPYDSLAWLLRGTLLAFLDRGEEAVLHVERAKKLTVLDPMESLFDSFSASAYLADGQFGKALMFASKSLLKNGQHSSTLRTKLTAEYYLGKFEAAKDTTQKLLDHQPTFTAAEYLKTHSAAGSRTGKMVVEAMVAMGIPEQ